MPLGLLPRVLSNDDLGGGLVGVAKAATGRRAKSLGHTLLRRIASATPQLGADAPRRVAEPSLARWDAAVHLSVAWLAATENVSGVS